MGSDNVLDVLVPRLSPRNALPGGSSLRSIQRAGFVEAGASRQCVPGLEPWNEKQGGAEA